MELSTSDKYNEQSLSPSVADDNDFSDEQLKQLLKDAEQKLRSVPQLSSNAPLRYEAIPAWPRSPI
jgi:hypothetical protein